MKTYSSRAIRLSVLISLCTLSAACGGADTDATAGAFTSGAPTNTDSVGGMTGVVDDVPNCIGKYRCSGTAFTARIEAGRCMFGQLWLQADGTVADADGNPQSIDGSKVTWANSGETFALCVRGRCFGCQRVQ